MLQNIIAFSFLILVLVFLFGKYKQNKIRIEKTKTIRETIVLTIKSILLICDTLEESCNKLDALKRLYKVLPDEDVEKYQLLAEETQMTSEELKKYNFFQKEWTTERLDLKITSIELSLKEERIQKSMEETSAPFSNMKKLFEATALIKKAISNIMFPELKYETNIAESRGNLVQARNILEEIEFNISNL